MNKTDEELLKEGWKKEMLCLHIQEYDPHPFNDKDIPFRRLSYDLRNDFTSEQIGTIKTLINEINNRFPNIKMSATGTGFYKPQAKLTDLLQEE